MRLVLRALLVSALIAVPAWHLGAHSEVSGALPGQVAGIVAQGPEGAAVVPERPAGSGAMTSRLEQRNRSLPTSAVAAWLLVAAFGITILAAWARRFRRPPAPVPRAHAARAPPALPLPS